MLTWVGIGSTGQKPSLSWRSITTVPLKHGTDAGVFVPHLRYARISLPANMGSIDWHGSIGRPGPESTPPTQTAQAPGVHWGAGGVGCVGRAPGRLLIFVTVALAPSAVATNGRLPTPALTAA